MAMTCEEKLAEAEDALHKLQTGQALVEIRDGDYIARYTSANVAQLTAYIQVLKAQCGPNVGGCGGTPARRAIRYRLT